MNAFINTFTQLVINIHASPKLLSGHKVLIDIVK